MIRFLIEFSLVASSVATAPAARVSPPSCADAPARSGYAMTYDSSRRLTVVFGGEDGTGSLSASTLGWDGKTWTCISETGPSPRSAAMLAYDASRNVLVLYGGRAGRTTFRDTWELGAQGWKLVNDSGPTSEPHGVMAFDRASRAVLLFNGFGVDGPARATWSWNGRAWNKLSDAPAQEFPNAMFSSTSTQPATLLTARKGEPGRGYSAPIYEWRGNSWAPVNVSGDVPAFSPQAPTARTRSGAILYAGFESNSTVTSWILDGTQWFRYAGESPSRRKGAQMVFDEARGVAVLHAGDDGSRVLDDTWEWNGSRWSRIR